QKPVGFHCTTVSSTQLNVPAGVRGDSNRIERSAAARSAMGLKNAMVTGAPTPTTSPGPGDTAATGTGAGTAAMAVLCDPVTRNVEIAVTANTNRTALKTSSSAVGSVSTS